MKDSKKNIYKKIFVLFILWIFTVIGIKNCLTTIKQNNCEDCIAWRKKHEVNDSESMFICAQVI